MQTHTGNGRTAAYWNTVRSMVTSNCATVTILECDLDLLTSGSMHTERLL